MEYVLITGASTGIGFEIAKVFAQQNYRLVLVSSNEQKLNLAKSELAAISSYPIHSYAIDLSELGSAKRLYEKCKENSLVITTLINNAGYGLVGSTETIDFKRDEQMMILNMITLVDLTKYFLADMYANGKGRILNVASTGAFQPGPFTSTYFASKAFVVSYSKAIGYEARSKNVLVSTLYPGATRTNFFTQEGVRTPMHAVSAEAVARYTYKKFTKGKKTIIPGLINKLQRFLPEKVTMGIIARMKQ